MLKQDQMGHFGPEVAGDLPNAVEPVETAPKRGGFLSFLKSLTIRDARDATLVLLGVAFGLACGWSLGASHILSKLYLP